MSNPTLREAIDAVLHEFRSELHTSFPARVLAYDALAQTVDVRPALQREVPTDDPTQPWGYDRLPDLYAVPIMWPRAGGFAITFPIKPGDWVEVTCAEQCTHVWRDKGDAPSQVGLNDPHGLNGTVAKPGYFPDKLRLTDVDEANLVLRSEDNSVRITITGSQVILGPAPDDTGAKFVALANVVDAWMAEIRGAFNGHVHASAAVGTPTGGPLEPVPVPPPIPPELPGAVSIDDLGSTAASMVKAK